MIAIGLVAGSALTSLLVISTPVSASCPSNGVYVGSCDYEANDTDCVSYWGVFYGDNQVGYREDRGFASNPQDPDGYCTNNTEFCFGADGTYPACYRPV